MRENLKPSKGLGVFIFMIILLTIAIARGQTLTQNAQTILSQCQQADAVDNAQIAQLNGALQGKIQDEQAQENCISTQQALIPVAVAQDQAVAQAALATTVVSTGTVTTAEGTTM